MFINYNFKISFLSIFCLIMVHIIDYDSFILKLDLLKTPIKNDVDYFVRYAICMVIACLVIYIRIHFYGIILNE